MTKFTPQFLDQIRDNLTLSDIIRQRVKLTRAGREFKGCCPFHKEKTPSFYVNDEKQFYHCFGCGAHGDAIRFLVEHDNVSFPEAVEQLAGKAGVPMPIQKQQTAADFHYEQVRKGLYELMDDAAKWFCQQLYTPENKPFLDYLNGRGVPRAMLSSFMIGCAPIDGQKLPAFLKAQGYDEDQMVESGLCRKSKKDGKPYAFFRERVMFPVLDRKGRVVTFGGRILPDHLRLAAGFPPHSGDFIPPKYINGSDSPLFNKSYTLYGEYQVRQSSREGHTPIVVEGYLDVIACHEAGFKGAMAPMGTALTEEQIQALWKIGAYNRKTPTLCFDGDNAGMRAAERAMDRILPFVSAERSVNFAFMPEGEDPDSFIKAKGTKALRDIFVNALSLVDYLWYAKTHGKTFATPEERAGLEKELNDAIEVIQENSTQSYYQRDIKDRLYKHFSSFKNKKGQHIYKANVVGRAEKYKQQAIINVSGDEQGVIESLQSILILAALKNFRLLEKFYDVMERRRFQNADLDHLRQHMLDLDVEFYQEDIAKLRHDLTESGYGNMIASLEGGSLRLHAPWLLGEREEHDLIKGWDSVVDRLDNLSHKAALEEAMRALEENFTEENAERLAALQRIKRQ